nr:MAG: nonstructural protein [Riboviria sp.]
MTYFYCTFNLKVLYGVVSLTNYFKMMSTIKEVSEVAPLADASSTSESTTSSNIQSGTRDQDLRGATGVDFASAGKLQEPFLGKSLSTNELAVQAIGLPPFVNDAQTSRHQFVSTFPWSTSDTVGSILATIPDTILIDKKYIPSGQTGWHYWFRSDVEWMVTIPIVPVGVGSLVAIAIPEVWKNQIATSSVDVMIAAFPSMQYLLGYQNKGTVLVPFMSTNRIEEVAKVRHTLYVFVFNQLKVQAGQPQSVTGTINGTLKNTSAYLPITENTAPTTKTVSGKPFIDPPVWKGGGGPAMSELITDTVKTVESLVQAFEGPLGLLFSADAPSQPSDNNWSMKDVPKQADFLGASKKDLKKQDATVVGDMRKLTRPAQYCKTYSRRGNINWTIAQVPGTVLFSYPVHPISIPLFTEWWPLFRYWRGSIKMRVQPICSVFHQGSFLIFVTPNKTPPVTMQEMLNANSVVYNIEAGKMFEISIPYASRTDWSFIFRYNLYVHCVVYNGLYAGPAAGNIDINVFFSAGEDFKLSIPSPYNFGLWPFAHPTEEDDDGIQILSKPVFSGKGGPASNEVRTAVSEVGTVMDVSKEEKSSWLDSGGESSIFTQEKYSTRPYHDYDHDDIIEMAKRYSYLHPTVLLSGGAESEPYNTNLADVLRKSQLARMFLAFSGGIRLGFQLHSNVEQEGTFFFYCPVQSSALPRSNFGSVQSYNLALQKFIGVEIPFYDVRSSRFFLDLNSEGHDSTFNVIVNPVKDITVSYLASVSDDFTVTGIVPPTKDAMDAMFNATAELSWLPQDTTIQAAPTLEKRPVFKGGGGPASGSESNYLGSRHSAVQIHTGKYTSKMTLQKYGSKTSEDQQHRTNRHYKFAEAPLTKQAKKSMFIYRLQACGLRQEVTKEFLDGQVLDEELDKGSRCANQIFLYAGDFHYHFHTDRYCCKGSLPLTDFRKDFEVLLEMQTKLRYSIHVPIYSTPRKKWTSSPEKVKELGQTRMKTYVNKVIVYARLRGTLYQCSGQYVDHCYSGLVELKEKLDTKKDFHKDAIGIQTEGEPCMLKRLASKMISKEDIKDTAVDVLESEDFKTGVKNIIFESASALIKDPEIRATVSHLVMGITSKLTVYIYDLATMSCVRDLISFIMHLLSDIICIFPEPFQVCVEKLSSMFNSVVTWFQEGGPAAGDEEVLSLWEAVKNGFSHVPYFFTHFSLSSLREALRAVALAGSACRGLSAIVQFLSRVFEWIRSRIGLCLTSLDKESFWFARNKKTITEIEEAYVKLYPEQETSIQNDLELMDLGVETKAKISTVLDHASHVALADSKSLLARAISYFDRKEYVPQYRHPHMEPILALFYSTAVGTGKSVTVERVAKALATYLNKGVENPKDIFRASSSEEYWESYTNQRVIILDDLGQIIESGDYDKICQLVSASPFNPGGASIAQKTRVCKSIFVLATSNRIVPDADVMTSKEALCRRFKQNFYQFEKFDAKTQEPQLYKCCPDHLMHQFAAKKIAQISVQGVVNELVTSLQDKIAFSNRLKDKTLLIPVQDDSVQTFLGGGGPSSFKGDVLKIENLVEYAEYLLKQGFTYADNVLSHPSMQLSFDFGASVLHPGPDLEDHIQNDMDLALFFFKQFVSEADFQRLAYSTCFSNPETRSRFEASKRSTVGTRLLMTGLVSLGIVFGGFLSYLAMSHLVGGPARYSHSHFRNLWKKGKKEGPASYTDRASLEKSMIRIGYKKVDGPIESSNWVSALHIRDGYYVTVVHIFQLRHDYRYYVKMVVNGVEAEFPVFMSPGSFKIVEFEGKKSDCCVFYLGMNVPRQRATYKLLATPEDYYASMDSNTVVFAKNEGSVKTKFFGKPKPFFWERSSYPEHLQHPFDKYLPGLNVEGTERIQYGECGSPAVAMTAEAPIIGMVFWGHPGGGGLAGLHSEAYDEAERYIRDLVETPVLDDGGPCQLDRLELGSVPSEDLDALKYKYNFIMREPLKVPDNPRFIHSAPVYTSFVPLETKYSDTSIDLQRSWGDSGAPSLWGVSNDVYQLHDGLPGRIFFESMRHAELSCINMEAAKEMFVSLVSCKFTECRVLELDEVLNGYSDPLVPDSERWVEDHAGAPLTRNSSAGWTMKGKGYPTKNDMLEFDGQKYFLKSKIQEDFAELCAALENGETPVRVSSAFLKDEILPQSKVHQGKIRVFFDDEALFIIAYRKYWGHVLDSLREWAGPVARHFNGLDPEANWERFHDWISENSDGCLAADISGWDTSVCPAWFELLFQTLSAFYPEATQGQINARHTLMASSVFVPVAYGKNTFVKLSGVLSGMCDTTGHNSFFHNLFILSALLEINAKLILEWRWSVLGDDELMSFPRGQEQLLDPYLQVVKRMGFNVTSADKVSEIMLQPMTQVQFLSRFFVKRENGIFSNLKLSSFVQMISWRKRGVPDEEVYRSAIMLAAHSGNVHLVRGVRAAFQAMGVHTRDVEKGLPFPSRCAYYLDPSAVPSNVETPAFQILYKGLEDWDMMDFMCSPPPEERIRRTWFCYKNHAGGDVILLRAMFCGSPNCWGPVIKDIIQLWKLFLDDQGLDPRRALCELVCNAPNVVCFRRSGAPKEAIERMANYIGLDYWYDSDFIWIFPDQHQASTFVRTAPSVRDVGFFECLPERTPGTQRIHCKPSSLASITATDCPRTRGYSYASANYRDLDGYNNSIVLQRLKGWAYPGKYRAPWVDGLMRRQRRAETQRNQFKGVLKSMRLLGFGSDT